MPPLSFRPGHYRRSAGRYIITGPHSLGLETLRLHVMVVSDFNASLSQIRREI